MNEPKPMDARDIVSTINEALEMDQQSVSYLLKQDVGINPVLADHPTTIQCSDDEDGIPMLRMIGLLNGVLLPDYVMYEIYSEEGNLTGVTLSEVDYFCAHCHRFSYKVGDRVTCSRGPNSMGWSSDGGHTVCEECFEDMEDIGE